MSNTIIQDTAQLEKMMQQEKAVLFFFVEWSVYPHMTRPKFTNMAQRITSDYPNAQVGFYTVHENAEFVMAWFQKSRIEGVPEILPFGWGIILCFQRGKVTHSLYRAHELAEEEMYPQTIKAFDL